MNAPRLLISVGLVVLVLLVVVVLLMGRTLRKQVWVRVGGGMGSSPIAALPTGVARTLTDRGLINAQQLASMSPAERDFFVAAVAAQVGEGIKPKLVHAQSSGASPAQPATYQSGTTTRMTTTTSRSGPGGITTTATTKSTTAYPGGGAQSAPGAVDPVALAAIVSSGIYCPVCRSPLGQRSDAELRMSRCPGCSRRIGVRVEGDRLTVTVQYGSPTPGAGVPSVTDGGGAAS